MQKAYNRINWENYPSETTPINEDNLNAMDSAMNEIDNRVVNFDTTKANATDVLTMISDVSYNEASGIFTFTRKNGSVFTLDTKLEKLAINWSYDSINEVLIITLDDGTTQEVPLSALINELDFLDSDTIAFEVENGKVSAIVKEGSIEEKHLQPNYLADVKAESSKAETQANSAEQSAKEAKEYAEAAAESASKAEALTGPVVSGIKGSAESDFRTGQVTISPEDLGLGDVLEMLGNVGGLNAKIFNSTEDSEWRSTISNIDDIPVGYMGYVYTAMGAPTEGMLFCYGMPNAGYRVQLCTSLYGGGTYIRYLAGTTWADWKKISTSDALANYLPLTGGYVDGNVVPKTDSTKLLGIDTLAWLAVYANQFNLLKGGQSYGSWKVTSEGTESDAGYTYLFLGNNKKEGESGNSFGLIGLYGKGKGYTQLTPNNHSDTSINIALPSTGGKLALTSDITALNTLTPSEQSVVTYFIESVFSVMSTTTAISSGFFQKEGVPYAWTGLYQQANYASFTVHSYGIRALHLQLNNGVWTYNAMDNK